MQQGILITAILFQCFPNHADINATLELLLQVIQVFTYLSQFNEVIIQRALCFQCLSTEVTCESGSVLAATLANGGVCPMSGDQVLSTSAVRNTLSTMQVAGMNDYSRTFHFKVTITCIN